MEDFIDLFENVLYPAIGILVVIIGAVMFLGTFL